MQLRCALGPRTNHQSSQLVRTHLVQQYPLFKLILSTPTVGDINQLHKYFAAKQYHTPTPTRPSVRQRTSNRRRCKLSNDNEWIGIIPTYDLRMEYMDIRLSYSDISGASATRLKPSQVFPIPHAYRITLRVVQLER